MHSTSLVADERKKVSCTSLLQVIVRLFINNININTIIVLKVHYASVIILNLYYSILIFSCLIINSIAMYCSEDRSSIPISRDKRDVQTCCHSVCSNVEEPARSFFITSVVVLFISLLL